MLLKFKMHKFWSALGTKWAPILLYDRCGAKFAITGTLAGQIIMGLLKFKNPTLGA
jgi:hypothetical protein